MNRMIYRPSGKAGEYAAFACNLYNGCSNGCTYCYLKRFPAVFGNTPKLSKKWKNEDEALAAFRKALTDADEETRREYTEKGITFSFSTDPFLPETTVLNTNAMLSCLDAGIPVHVLTKMIGWTKTSKGRQLLSHPRAKDILAIGFTITGLDRMEPNADSNEMRIHTLRKLHDEGYITWVSMEPVTDYPTALEAVRKCAPHAKQLKIGLLSGIRLPLDDTVSFINSVRRIANDYGTKIYWKQSIRNCIGGGSPFGLNFVENDWNIFSKNS